MDKAWFGSYQKGIPHEIDLSSYSSLADMLESGFKQFRGLPSFHNMGRTLSFGEMDTLSARFAGYLQGELGLKKGDRVAIMMPNLLQYPVALFGALRAGLIVVNVNPLYTARELEHQLVDSGAQAIVILENFAHVLEKVLAKTSVKHVISTQVGDLLKKPKSLLVNFVLKRVKKMVPTWRIAGAVSFNDALARGGRKSFTRPALTHEDIAFLQYTGGTTGVSKGAMLTHGNMVANMLQARAWISTLTHEGREIIVTALPLYHIFSLTANCFIFSSIGALNVLITNPRDFDGFVKELKKWKFTAITGVNTLFNALLNHPEFKNVDFSALNLTLGGGMAVQKSVAERWKLVTDTPLIEAYGLTETSPAACMNPMDLKEYNGFVGLPVPSTDVVIKDEAGRDLPFDEVGEVCIKGPQVMRGYWQRADETAQVFTSDGYLKTGDLGFMNAFGFTKLVDRKKDMILVSGFNVYPNEIEDVVAMCPKVLESAAIGIPDEKSGESVKLFVVKKDPSLTEKEVIDHCRVHMTAYKIPRSVEFRSELPKSNVGKILRKDLRPV
jgi:long-chain acyl-CoA synthetase